MPGLNLCRHHWQRSTRQFGSSKCPRRLETAKRFKRRKLCIRHTKLSLRVLEDHTPHTAHSNSLNSSGEHQREGSVKFQARALNEIGANEHSGQKTLHRGPSGDSSGSGTVWADAEGNTLRVVRKPGKEDCFVDYVWVMSQWSPLQKRLIQKKPVSRQQCSEFGQALLSLLREYREWGGTALSTALHRLAVLRDSQEHFPEECVSAFFWLVQRLGATAPHMSSMSLSMSVWAVGKLCLLENYALPVQGRRFKPSGEPEPESERDGASAPASREDTQSGNEARGAASASQEAPTGTSADDGGQRRPDENDGSSSEEESLVAVGRDGAVSEASTARKPRVNWQVLERRARNTAAQSGQLQTLGGLARQPLRLKVQQQLPEGILDDFDAIARLFIGTMHKATAQGVCNTMWGFARMGYSPLEGEFFKAVQLRALELMGEIRAQDVSNLWMAHGLLKEPMQEELLTKLTDATRQLIHRRKLGAISVPIILQACVRLGVDDSDLFDDLLYYLYYLQSGNEQPLKRLTSESMTNLLCAVVHLKPSRTQEFVDAWAKQCARRIGEYSFAQAVAIAAAFEKLGVSPTRKGLFHTLKSWQDFRSREEEIVAAGTPGADSSPAVL